MKKLLITITIIMTTITATTANAGQLHSQEAFKEIDKYCNNRYEEPNMLTGCINGEGKAYIDFVYGPYVNALNETRKNIKFLKLQVIKECIDAHGLKTGGNWGHVKVCSKSSIEKLDGFFKRKTLTFKKKK